MRQLSDSMAAGNRCNALLYSIIFLHPGMQRCLFSSGWLYIRPFLSDSSRYTANSTGKNCRKKRGHVHVNLRISNFRLVGPNLRLRLKLMCKIKGVVSIWRMYYGVSIMTVSTELCMHHRTYKMFCPIIAQAD